MLTSAAAVYTWVASVQWVDMDEGVALEAARIIAHGGVPFVTFAGREPGLFYYLAIGVSLFGPSLLVARLQVVLLVLLAAIPIYLIGRNVHSKGAGLAACAIFLFNPFDVYSFTVVTPEPALLLPLAWAAYLTLRPGPLTRASHVPIAIGFLLGVAELFRRDAILLLPIFLAVWVLRLPYGRPFQGRSGLLVVLGFLLTFGTVLAAFASATSLAWMWDEYGLGAAYTASTVPLPYHVGVLWYLLVYQPIVVVPVLFAWAGSLRAKGGTYVPLLVLGLGSIGLAYLADVGPAWTSFGQGEYLFPALLAVPVLAALFWLVGTGDLLGTALPGPSIPRSFLALMLLWGLALLGFYTFVYPEFFTSYFVTVALPLSLLTGVWWADRVSAYHEARAGRQPLSKGRPSPSRSPWSWLHGAWLEWFPILLSVVLVASSLFSAVAVLGPSNPYNRPVSEGLSQVNSFQRTYAPALVSQVSSYLDAHTAPGSTLFSADDTFVAAADRIDLLNLSFLWDDYVYGSAPNNATIYPSDPFHLAPSLSQVLDRWNRTAVPYVVEGPRTRALESMHPLVAWYVMNHYHPVLAFGNGLEVGSVTLLALGPANVSGGSEVGTLPSGGRTSAVVVGPSNGSVITGDLQEGFLRVGETGGPTWEVPLPNGCPGTSGLAFDNASSVLWVGCTTDFLDSYHFPSTGSPALGSVLSLPAPPGSLSLDLSHDRLFVALPRANEVVALNSTTGAFSGNLTDITDPTALAVDPTHGELFVGSSTAMDYTVYGELNGSLLGGAALGIEPNGLLVGPHEVVASSWDPSLLVWVNRSVGNITREVYTPSELNTILPIGPYVAAVSLGGEGLYLYGIESGNTVGVVFTGGCPGEASLDPAIGEVWVASPCGAATSGWSLAPPLELSLAVPSGSEVFLDGNLVVGPYAFPVLPGWHSFTVVWTGRVPFESSSLVTTGGTYQPVLGAPLAQARAVGDNFTWEVAGAAALLLVLAIVAPELYPACFRPRSRSGRLPFWKEFVPGPGTEGGAHASRHELERLRTLVHALERRIEELEEGHRPRSPEGGDHTAPDRS